MPQFFQVLRCYECQVFQVHQAKKSNKWACKMCGEKQSMKRRYGVGTAKDCRGHVQRLNGIRGENDETEQNNTYDDEDLQDVNENNLNVNKKLESKQNSKWNEFITEEENSNHTETTNNMFLDNVEVVLELPKKRAKRNLHQNNTKKFNIPYKKDPLQSSLSNDIIETLSQSKEKLVSNTEAHSSTKSRTIVPKVQKNSKWAQYTDLNYCEIDPEQELNNKSTKVYNKQTLFSLSEDSDIDDILNI